MLSCNARSLIGKIDDLTNIIQRHEYKKAGIIMLQESWLHPDIEDDIVRIDGFQLFRNDRSVNFNKRGGGVVTFINQNWSKQVSVVYQYSTAKINCLVVECKPRFLSGFRSIVIGNIYLAPGLLCSELRTFSDLLSTALVSKLECSLCVIAGDFNRFDTAFLTTLGLSNLVHFPTRLDVQLDAVFTNRTQLFQMQKRAPLSTSDHCILKVCPIVCSKHNQHTLLRRPSRTVKQRNCSDENLAKLKCMVASTDFSTFVDQDPSIHCEHLTGYLNFCFDQCCPMETIFLRPDGFSSPLLKQLRRKKEKAYKQDMRSVVKHLSRAIRSEIQRLNKLYVNAVTGNKTCRELWRVLKQLCCTNSSGKEISVDVEKLNYEFCASHECTTLPVYSKSDAQTILEPVNVFTQLCSTKANKAAGPDALSPVVLKVCSDSLSVPFTDLFNKCLSSGKIPDIWRPARITPVPKKGSQKYRPIACTSVMLKLLERLLLGLIKSRTKVDDVNQFAYKPSRSTLDAVAHLVHSIASALDNRRKTVRLLFLDYKNAFGSVDRSVLLNLLSKKDVDMNIIRLLRDYFTDRSQFTYYKGKQSSSLPINSGVFQGAILSPFLFSLYIEQLPIPTPFFQCKYADDVVFGCIHPSLDHSSDIQQGINEIVSWSSFRSLSLNASKCQDVIFSLLRGNSYRNVSNNFLPVNVNNQSIPRSHSVRYLGVHISHNLSWSEHIQTTFCKVRKLSFYSLRLKML
ncbi:MAG: reverse transcriptase family protein, partial [Aeromonas sp.]